MFGLFGFDPASMSDDELLTKQLELQAKLVWASRFGGSDLVSSIQTILASIEFERMERVVRMGQKMRDQMFPPVIETDPELAAMDKPKEPKPDAGRITPAARPRITISKSQTPVVDQFDDPKDKKK